MAYFQTQGGARASLALGWLVDGPLALTDENGNFHLTRRQTDGAENFTIRKQRWVETRTDGHEQCAAVAGEGPRRKVIRVRHTGDFPSRIGAAGGMQNTAGVP